MTHDMIQYAKGRACIAHLEAKDNLALYDIKLAIEALRRHNLQPDREGYYILEIDRNIIPFNIKIHPKSHRMLARTRIHGVDAKNGITIYSCES